MDRSRKVLGEAPCAGELWSHPNRCIPFPGQKQTYKIWATYPEPQPCDDPNLALVSLKIPNIVQFFFLKSGGAGEKRDGGEKKTMAVC